MDLNVTEYRGRPGGVAVKFVCFTLVAQSSPVRIPGTDLALLIKACCGRHLTYKVEEEGHRVSSGLTFLSKKED